MTSPAAIADEYLSGAFDTRVAAHDIAAQIRAAAPKETP